jgi:pimeloyl-ACP methyl ester carboxylesterase
MSMNSISILALHGYHGSAQVLRRQIAPLADALPDSIDLTFVDAPSITRGDFGWWHEGFTGWEATRDWVADLAAGQHFDGVMGFSQGAALAGLLIAAQEAVGKGAADPAPLASGFGFGVMIGGFTSDEPEHAALFRRRLATPSLHVTGTADTIVPMRDSLRLAERFAGPVIITHDGGHVIPSDPRILGRIVAFAERRGRPAHVDYAAVQPAATRRD